MTTELLEHKAETQKEEQKELKGGLNTAVPPPPPEPEKPLDVQATVNEMFIKHGGNLPERGDYKDLLADYGLEQSQVTKKHLDVAKKNLAKYVEEESKKQGPERDNKLEWNTEPTTFECKDGSGKPDGTKGVRWTTKCNRYRVDMRSPADVTKPYFTSSYLTKYGDDMCCGFAPPKENSAKGDEPKKYKNFDAALASVENFHALRYKLAVIFCNRQAVLDTAAELGLITKIKSGGKPVVVSGPVTTQVAMPNGMPATTAIATPTTAQGSTTPNGQATGLPATPKAPRTNYSVLGFALSRFCHYLGAKNTPYERVVRILAHYGVPIGDGGANPTSVRTYLTDGRNAKYAKPATLSKEQEEEIEKIV